MTVNTDPEGQDPPPGDTNVKVLRMLAQMNAKLDAQQQASGNRLRDDMPTLSSYADACLETLGAGTRRTYRSPLRRLNEFAPCKKLDPTEVSAPVGGSPSCTRLRCTDQHTQLGDVPLDLIVRSDLDRFAAHVRAEHRRASVGKLRQRRFEAARQEGLPIALSDIAVSDGDIDPKVGNSGKEGAISAMAWLFGTAEGDLLRSSPAVGLKKPHRVRTAKRSFNDGELLQVASVAVATASDPELIELLLWLYLVSGARQGEGLAARLTDIDLDRQTLRLGQKNGEKLEQPLPLSLIVALMEFAHERGATPADDRILRNSRGQGISRATHSKMWAAVRAELPWAAAMDAATHCLRKTGATAVERHAGAAISEAWLRHAVPSLNGVYTGAALEEVATVVADLTGEPHPLATRAPQPAATALLLPGSMR